MRGQFNREALALYETIAALFAAHKTDRLQPDPRLTISRRDNIIVCAWRPYGFSTTVFCAVTSDDGSPPCIVRFDRGAWVRIIRRIPVRMICEEVE
jgi:hypothetical protein